jgi:hypothetical protein
MSATAFLEADEVKLIRDGVHHHAVYWLEQIQAEHRVRAHDGDYDECKPGQFTVLSWMHMGYSTDVNDFINRKLRTVGLQLVKSDRLEMKQRSYLFTTVAPIQPA